MGSFHSENVDDLMSQSDDVYTPPPLPFEDDVSADVNTDDDSNFLLDRNTWTFLNHGAFGAALGVGYQRAEQWRYHLERQPLRYFDRDLLPHLVYSARRLADFMHAPREATTLIPNVTYGLNTVLRGYSRTYKDQAHIILWDTSYGSLKKMAHEYCDKVTEIPVSDYFRHFDKLDDPNAIFEQALSDTLGSMNIDDTANALLILDHTTSNTAINMPLQSLSHFGKERNMLVMVDGAHGLLAQDVSLDALPNVDFYLANGHKWLSCPRGIGILYCSSSELRDTVLEQPAVISHGIGQGFQTRFLWDGCRDYAAALSVPAVLDYWQEKGVPQVQQQIRTNLQTAVALLGNAWHESEELVTLAPMELHAPMMALVRLPNSLQEQPSTSDDAKRIQDYLYDQFIEVPIKCIHGVLYVRISCHVYNELLEYERLAQVLLRYDQT
jgi:isopenicillin-N epimerase